MFTIPRIITFNKLLIQNCRVNNIYNKTRIPFKNTTDQNLKSEEKFPVSKTIYDSKAKIPERKLEISKELIDKDDPDRFGTLSGVTVFTEKYDEDEGDKREEEHIGKRGRGLRTKQYADMIKEHLINKRVKDALDILEIKMIKEDRVKPENYIYNLLISGCAQVGYTKKAFRLFNDMKKRGLSVTGGTYTSLFNACSNSPWPEDGLQRANNLRELMIEKGYVANITNYNAMIKAFGRCGDLKTAFLLVDEMVDNKLEVTISTLNFLLQACISDKNAGFRHALLTWRKMIHLRKRPNVYSFNLMLRCVKDCGLGDLEATTELFDSLPKNNISLEDNSTKMLIESPEINASSNNTLQVINDSDTVPNLLSKSPHLGGIVAIKDITKPEHRLLLIGGASGFLKEMYDNKTVPDIKTYTQLLEIIPSTNSAEKAFLKTMKKTKEKVDICFFNMLMKRRCLRYEYDSAREVLPMIETAGLRPDIITYGVLAMTCQTKYEAKDLLNDIINSGYRINSEVLGAMLNMACSKLSFGYVLQTMEMLLQEDVEPNIAFYHCLEKFHQKCSRYKSDLYNDVYPEDIKRINKDYFLKGFDIFSKRYVSWTQQIKEKYPDGEMHPWKQFQKSFDGGFEDVKMFERKRKIRKRFIRAIL